jgi:hypothetical protein
MDEGDAWVARKRFDKALDAYEGADALMNVPTTAIEVARTLEALGRLVEAREKALEIGQMPGAETEPHAFAIARHDAAQLLERIEPRIPTLRVEVTTPGVEPSSVRASVDDEAVPERLTLTARRVNPGRHVVQVRAPGRTPTTREIDVKEGARAVVSVELASVGVPTEASEPVTKPGGGMPTEAIAGFAVAGAAVTVGTIAGLMSLSNASDARTLCGPDPKNCDPAASDAIDSSRTLGWVSTISFGVAFAGAGVATYFLLSTKKSDAAAKRVRVVPTGAGAAVMGSF